jgi:hypothetical protein
MLEKVVDARWLEPPEPMELTVAALHELAGKGRLRLLIHRMPYMLFPMLQEWGYLYQTNTADDGTYEILIWYKEQAVTYGDQGLE